MRYKKDQKPRTPALMAAVHPGSKVRRTVLSPLSKFLFAQNISGWLIQYLLGQVYWPEY